MGPRKKGIQCLLNVFRAPEIVSGVSCFNLFSSSTSKGHFHINHSDETHESESFINLLKESGVKARMAWPQSPSLALSPDFGIMQILFPSDTRTLENNEDTGCHM